MHHRIYTSAGNRPVSNLPDTHKVNLAKEALETIKLQSTDQSGGKEVVLTDKPVATMKVSEGTKVEPTPVPADKPAEGAAPAEGDAPAPTAAQSETTTETEVSTENLLEALTKTASELEKATATAV